jgi:hypothetical protein
VLRAAGETETRQENIQHWLELDDGGPAVQLLTGRNCCSDIFSSPLPILLHFILLHFPFICFLSFVFQGLSFASLIRMTSQLIRISEVLLFIHTHPAVHVYNALR